jgi:hypothetical protein
VENGGNRGIDEEGEGKRTSTCPVAVGEWGLIKIK